MAYLKENKILAIVILGSFFLSLGYSFYHRIAPVVDAQAYDNIAVNILSGAGFRENTAKDIIFDTAIIRAGPAYEYFLAAVYYVFGHHYGAVWVWQAILHAFTALFLYFACIYIFGERGKKVGVLAAALLGFHPDLIEISAMLMTETLYLFLVTLVLLFFVKLVRAPVSNIFHAKFGLVVALAFLARPPVLLFLPVVVIFYVVKKYYAQLAIFVIFFAVAIFPWTARNYFIYHQFIPTTLVGEYNLWLGNTLQSSGGQISGGYNPATSFGEKLGYVNFGTEAKKQFVSFALARRVDFLVLTAKRFTRYFSLIRPMGFWFYQHGVGQMAFVASSLLGIAILFMTGFSGIFMSMREKNITLWYLAALALTAPLALIFAVVEARYRFQIYPFLAIFGAYFILTARERFHDAKRYFIVAAVFLGAVSLVDILSSTSKILEKINLFF